MQYPISIAVIKQAIEWSVVPNPLHVRQVGRYLWPDGTTTADYIITFEGADVRRTYDYAALYDGSAGFTKVMHDLHDAFCADFTIIRGWCDARHDKMSVELYGKVTRHDDFYQLPLIDQVDDEPESDWLS